MAVSFAGLITSASRMWRRRRRDFRTVDVKGVGCFLVTSLNTDLLIIFCKPKSAHRLRKAVRFTGACYLYRCSLAQIHWVGLRYRSKSAGS